MRLKYLLLISLLSIFISCSDEDTSTPSPMEEAMYFPPNNTTTWETKTPESLNWNTANVAALNTYLSDKHTKGFIVLHNGKIVMEQYFNGHSSTSLWYWASAGKTLTSTVTGIE